MLAAFVSQKRVHIARLQQRFIHDQLDYAGDKRDKRTTPFVFARSNLRFVLWARHDLGGDVGRPVVCRCNSGTVGRAKGNYAEAMSKEPSPPEVIHGSMPTVSSASRCLSERSALVGSPSSFV
jgi:hypothetical protein